MPPRFDGARRGGRGSSRGGGSGSRIFSSRGRGSRGRSRMSFGQTRGDKASSAPADGSMSNWTNELTEGSNAGHPPPNGDEGIMLRFRTDNVKDITILYCSFDISFVEISTHFLR